LACRFSGTLPGSTDFNQGPYSYIVGILFLIFDLEILLIYPLAVTLYQVSTYGFWITMIFFAILTVGFVLEIGSGALYFTDQKTSVVSLRPEDNSPSNPLLQSCLLGLAAISVIDCSSLNDWLETISSLPLDVDFGLSCVLTSALPYCSFAAVSKTQVQQSGKRIYSSS